MAKVNIEVKKRDNHPFLSLKEGTQIEDSLTIVSEHRNIPGKYGKEQTVVDVNYKGQVYTLALNTTSLMNIIQAHGDDSVNWVDTDCAVRECANKKYGTPYKALFPIFS